MRCLFALINLLCITVFCFSQHALPSRIEGGLPRAGSQALYQIQVGAFSSEQNALNASNLLRSGDFDVVSENFRGLTRVIVYGIPANEVIPSLEEIRQLGFNSVIIREYARLLVRIPYEAARPAAPPIRDEEEAKEPLFRFTRFRDGTYGYDVRSPVSYHAFTNEQVRLPRGFTPAKRQFRAAWAATVHNLDIPLTSSREEFQYYFNRMLDTFQEWNMNALIFQVRPTLDAFYQSRINPWSQFLNGRQGTDPLWDPLEWMIAQTHGRGMEFHAWFNPYRVTAINYNWLSVPGRTGAQLAALGTVQLIRALNAGGILADNNFAVLHPEYVYRFNGRLYLDPGFPAVRQHVVDTIREVIENYDVDAIHFDDYFYPYPAGRLVFGNANEDRVAFERYGLGRFPDTPAGIEQWRRENNTALVRAVRAAISDENRKNNRAIQFGISPFGIWEHRQNDPRGSNTPLSSLRTFSGSVLADTYLWVREGLIDYIVPQIYWSFDQGAAPYAELVRWWASLARGVNVNLYIGHANYNHLDSASTAWRNPEEILNQLRFNQLHPEVSGSVFFRYRRLLPSPETGPRQRAANAAIELLRTHFQTHKTISPPMPWLQSAAPEPVFNLVRNGNTITWNDSEDNNSRYYVVYRVLRSRLYSEGLDRVINDPFNIVARIWRKGRTEFTFTVSAEPDRYVYIVKAFNAAHIESAPVIAGEAGPGTAFGYGRNF